ncbi:monooxygenase [Aspergillus eucalypticola CBS 122712]|uniref:Monooxygenase n=1 Tax=Aspergillus eucalypticola (strain CBS 122712 / IBT 29274) TaxID=1448314 RepID=A0A317VYR0_ASPEC|nr:monooxygenase [Aspergillus eucalypticola CBS 122712]PWY78769.1 monooxygenase [Aspergillus eucalypticola CBS 122712]
MTGLKILISGAGIAGNALAFWLSKLGHNITIIERYPGLRATGLQVDLRSPGIEVLQRMGLEKAFRKVTVPEQGLKLVDSRDRRWGYFPANRSGKGLQSFTTDYEIMRGDLCYLLHDTVKDRVEYLFGVYVVEMHQTDEFVDVVLSDGRKEQFDLVVGADGLGSRTRSMMLEGEDQVHSIGVCAGYFTIESELKKGEGYDATVYMTTQGRGIMMRRHDPHKIQAYVFCKAGPFQDCPKGDVEREKQVMGQVFQDAGWKSEEIIRGMEEADDFYCERMGVVNLDSWSRGRVVLVGDAAYCPSAMTGMGTPCAMVGAYILAGEIGKRCAKGTGSKEHIAETFKSYEDKLKPFMVNVQKGLLDDHDYMSRLPSSTLGITVVYLLFAIASFLRLDVLAQWILREDCNKDWRLPEYPNMVDN